MTSERKESTMDGMGVSKCWLCRRCGKTSPKRLLTHAKYGSALTYCHGPMERMEVEPSNATEVTDE